MVSLETLIWLAVLVGLPYYWRVWLPEQRRRQAERILQRDAWTNTAAAKQLYPVAGPDAVWNVLRAAEQLTDLQERNAVLVQAALARVPPPLPVAPPPVVTPAEVASALGPEPAAAPAATPAAAPASAPPLAPPPLVAAEFPISTFEVSEPVRGGPHFEAGEPTTLAQYVGQADAKLQLGDAIRAMAPHEVACGTWVFLGPAGLGKTALMRAFGNTLRLRNLAEGHGETLYVEVFPQDIATRDDLERVLKRVRGHNAVLQIDEVHTLDVEFAVVLYELMERRRYQFHGATEATPFDRLTVLTATTDFASCHAALRSRLTKVFLNRVTPEDIAAAIRLRPFPCTDAAVAALVARMQHAGVMRDAIAFYKQSVIAAKARGSTVVDVLDVDRVWQFNRVDEHGLQEPERAVIRALLQMPRVVRGRRGDPDTVVYVGSESNVTQVAGVDLGAYRVIHRPRLMQRGLLTTASSGQQLTPKAIQLYGGLR